MEEVEEICKCGIDYQTFIDYDLLCVGDYDYATRSVLHVWEEK